MMLLKMTLLYLMCTLGKEQPWVSKKVNGRVLVTQTQSMSEA